MPSFLFKKLKGWESKKKLYAEITLGVALKKIHIHFFTIRMLFPISWTSWNGHGLNINLLFFTAENVGKI